MKLWTYEEIENKVRRDLGMQDTVFISNDEMVGHCNDAIDEAEQEILKINEDYFLRRQALTMTSGTETVDLPSDIYANKLKGLVYKNGSIVYPVKRLKGMMKFLDAEHINTFSNNTADYEYMIQAATEGEQSKIRLFPTPYETGAYLICWYLRNAKRVPIVGESSATRSTQLATVLDLPEASNFIMAHMKVACTSKERGQGSPPDPEKIGEREAARKRLVDTLTEQTADDSNEHVFDIGHYLEHS